LHKVFINQSAFVRQEDNYNGNRKRREENRQAPFEGQVLLSPQKQECHLINNETDQPASRKQAVDTPAATEKGIYNEFEFHKKT
jgi:hypothetical protein